MRAQLKMLIENLNIDRNRIGSIQNFVDRQYTP